MCCLRFLFYTYLLILIYPSTLYYYMNLIKLINVGNIKTTTKFSILKSISSIEDNYLEAAIAGVQ